MIQEIRRRHAYFFIVLSIFLPFVVGFSLYFKVGLDALQTSKEDEKRLLKHGKLLFDSSNKKKRSGKKLNQKNIISFQVFGSLSKKQERIFVIKPHKPIKSPDVLVYLSKTPLKNLKSSDVHKKLSASILLGGLIGNEEQRFTVDVNITKKFRLLTFYSKPFSKVVEEIRFSLR